MCARIFLPPGNRIGVLQAPSSPLVLEWVTFSLSLKWPQTPTEKGLSCLTLLVLWRADALPRGAGYASS